jgi:hypothetical protein
MELLDLSDNGLGTTTRKELTERYGTRVMIVRP